MTDQARADQLAQLVARSRGINPAPLGPVGQVAYGTLMFKYLPEPNQLAAAILIADDPLWNKLGDTLRQNYLRSVSARTDPRIGGLFDTGGGTWMFEPATGKSFLYRAFSLDTPAPAISHAIDAMAAVAPAWETRWRGAVADIAHGKAPPPTHRVTLDHDPYAGQM